MGKRNAVNVEPWGSQTEDAAPEAKATVEPTVSEIVVGVPVAEFGNSGFVTRHVQLQLDANQANILHRISKAMDVRGERLNNGKRVITRVDTIRRILELIEQP